MFKVEICFNDCWICIGRDFLSTDAANWAIAMWKQSNDCHGDRGFRVSAQ